MTTVDRERLSITALGEREIVMARVFDAPRRLVWDAWTRPELFVRWFGTRGWTIPTCEMDVRPGGSYRYVMRRADGSEEMVMRGEYREVVPPERLVTTETWEGFSEPGWRAEDATVTTTLLTERHSKTTWTATLLYPSREVRDAALNLQPAWEGAAEGFDRLAALLAELL
jgi:uncharacterized protein YndB with AHSA1/START domain